MTYRPNRYAVVFVILVASPFAAIGVTGPYVYFFNGDTGALCIGSVIAGIGLFLYLSAFDSVGFRISLDADGIVRSSWFGLLTYRDTWDSLKSWKIVKRRDYDGGERLRVEFDCEGRRWPFQIDEAAVGVPGFDKFLEEIRSRAPSKKLSQDPAKA